MRERTEAPVIECPEAEASKMRVHVRDQRTRYRRDFSLILKVGVHMSNLLCLV
jgi:hypothetical protein